MADANLDDDVIYLMGILMVTQENKDCAARGPAPRHIPQIISA